MTLWLPKEAVKIPEMEGTSPPRKKRSPGDQSPEGRARTARSAHFGSKSLLGLPTSARKPTRASRKGVQPQNKTKRGKTKQGTRSNEAPLPPRVRGQGLREVPRESKKRPGPRMAPRQNARRKGRTAKTGDKPGCGGDTDKKRKKNTRCVWGCALLLPELSLSKKRKDKKDDDVGETTKGRKKTTQKHQTWHQENFFKAVSGAKKQIIKQKHRKNSTKTRKTHTDTQKRKFAPENFFKKRPLEEKNGKKTTKDTGPDTKNTKWKKRTAFPPSRRGKRKLWQYGCRS